MDCKKLKDYLDDFILGELDAETEMEINEHLDTCTGCKAELEKYEGVRQFLYNDNISEPSQEAYKKIQSVVAMPVQRKNYLWIFPKSLVYAAGAFIFGVMLMRSVDILIIQKSESIKTETEYRPAKKEQYTDTVRFYTAPPRNLVKL